MLDCPISFGAWFQLIATVEGLSLWGVFNTLPNRSRRKRIAAFRQTWKTENNELSPKERSALSKLSAKVTDKLFWNGIQVRIFKIMPSAELILLLLIYVGCPAFTRRSASEILAPWWHPLCVTYFCYIWARVIWFVFLYKSFISLSRWVEFADVPNPNDFSLEQEI